MFIICHNIHYLLLLRSRSTVGAPGKSLFELLRVLSLIIEKDQEYLRASTVSVIFDLNSKRSRKKKHRTLQIAINTLRRGLGKLIQ